GRRMPPSHGRHWKGNQEARVLQDEYGHCDLREPPISSANLRLGRHSSIGFDKRAGCLGSVNSSSSMGAPFSTMNATRTPSDGLFGGIRISRRESWEEGSATPTAACGPRRKRGGTAASASKRIHSTPNSLFW